MDEKTENFLAHYGVKGMHWGKHRPMNLDAINGLLEAAAYDTTAITAQAQTAVNGFMKSANTAYSNIQRSLQNIPSRVGNFLRKAFRITTVSTGWVDLTPPGRMERNPKQYVDRLQDVSLSPELQKQRRETINRKLNEGYTVTFKKPFED